MTHEKLIENLSKRTGLNKKTVKNFLECLSDTITTNTVNGEKTHVSGLGTFDLGSRAERRGRNPRTGEMITIPKMPMPIFRAGTPIKKAVRK